MTLKQPVKQKGFTHNWQNNPTRSVDLDEGYSAMRDWQVPAFEKLKDSPYIILNAPMGSGKSWMMCLLSAFKMKQSKLLRTIIAVPQTIIAPGFTEAKIKMPDGSKLHWEIKHNLCDNKKLNQGTVDYLIRWLSNQTPSFDDRTIICTHATLLATYRELRASSNLYLLKNLLLWIDEAHHIKNNAIDGLDGAILNNGLGELTSYALTSQEDNIEIGLTTASFYRGDRYSLLTPDMESKFKRHNLPYDKYLKSMTHLKSFNIDFLLCGPDYVKAIELILRQRQGKDIIYIPHPVSRHSTGDKHTEVNNIIAVYQAIHGAANNRSADGLLTLFQNGNEFKVLDLVSEFQRSQKKDFLKDLKKKNSLDSIVTLGMFKEGANWIWADRSIIVGSRSSLVDVIQMIGRLFRDAPGKEHVEVIQLLPFALDQRDENSFKENLNNYLKALYASLILENILNPVKIKTNDKTQKSKEQLTNNTASAVNEDWLSIAIPDNTKQQMVIEDVSNHLVDIAASNQDAFKQVSELRDGYEKIIPRILEKHGITEYKEEIASQIWNMLTRRSLNMQGIAVEDFDFEIIQNTNPLEFLIRYTSGICNIDTFQKLREAIQASRVIWRSFVEARSYVQSLGLRSEAEWQSYISGNMPNLPPLPNDIPKAPWAVEAYEQEWISSPDFLGTDQIAPKDKKYRSYDDACIFVHALEVKRKEDWGLYCKGMMPDLPPLPNDIPAAPDKTYKRPVYGNKWTTWGNFLGIKRISNHAKSKNWMPYEKAKEFAQSLGLKTYVDWVRYIKEELDDLPSLPDNMPRKPDEVYKEWISWTEFLGGEISKFNCNREFWSFNDARNFIQKLGLKNQKEWQKYCAGKLAHLPPKPLEIPSNPEKKYKNLGWKNTKQWLGISGNE